MSFLSGFGNGTVFMPPADEKDATAVLAGASRRAAAEPRRSERKVSPRCADHNDADHHERLREPETARPKENR